MIVIIVKMALKGRAAISFDIFAISNHDTALWHMYKLTKRISAYLRE